jgi:beta-mannosidase
MCDELGILAWSESVFACGAYPISPDSFLDNIRAEVSENVARLNRHPSTALWAGNNEVSKPHNDVIGQFLKYIFFFFSDREKDT